MNDRTPVIRTTTPSAAQISTVEIVEVGARDGLQNEPEILPTADKIDLIGRLVDAGARRLEAASFVNPRRVPQMADAEAVLAGLHPRTEVILIGLVLNAKGAERAAATKAHEFGAVACASNSFGIRNQGQTSAESVEAALDILNIARAHGRSAQVTISTAFGCPFEGEVDPGHVADMAARLAEGRPREIALADTIGAAVPRQVARLFARTAAAAPGVALRAHFHNTRNTGIANAWAALEAGAHTLDSSLGGLGGCPFAPGAAGNVATEDLVYLLERSGVTTGLDLDKLIVTSHWLAARMGKTLPSMVARAGGFPRAHPPAAPHSGTEP
jgi:hydroxymethylglutaryl-CoA lyase